MKKNSVKKQVPAGDQKKTGKSSAQAATAKASRSAVNKAKHDSNTDVRGSSGLANTGPFVSYNDGE